MSRTSETEPHAGLPLHGAETSAPSRLSEPKMTRAQILELLQAEVDRHRPLEDKRRAAAILAETSIRFTDEPETEGFVIAGPNGQPRTIVRDGQTVPFTLQDLAAEVRSKYPALFYSAEAGDHGAHQVRRDFFQGAPGFRHPMTLRGPDQHQRGRGRRQNAVERHRDDRSGHKQEGEHKHEAEQSPHQRNPVRRWWGAGGRI